MGLWAIYIYAFISAIALIDRGVSQIHEDLIKKAWGKDVEFRLAVKHYSYIAMFAFCIWIAIELWDKFK